LHSAGLPVASKKKANHPLLAGTPMCDEVHEILGLPSPPQLTSYLNLNPGFYWLKPQTQVFIGFGLKQGMGGNNKSLLKPVLTA
jgi:hypothetical protein